MAKPKNLEQLRAEKEQVEMCIRDSNTSFHNLCFWNVILNFFKAASLSSDLFIGQIFESVLYFLLVLSAIQEVRFRTSSAGCRPLLF